jgi:uncharacterized coiled-coil DUF342 family protein
MRVPTIQECAQAGWTEVANLREKLKALEAQRDEYRENGDRLMRVADSFKAVRDEALAEVERLKAIVTEAQEYIQELNNQRKQDEALLRECWDVMQSTSPYGLFYNKLKERLGETE